MSFLFSISMCCESISLGIGLVVIVHLACQTRFKPLFYRFVQFDLLMNIIIYLNSIPTKLELDSELKEPVVAFFHDYPILLRARNLIGHWSYHIQCCSLLLKCIFRFTYCKSTNAPEFWRKRFPLMLLLTVLFSLLLTVPFVLIAGTDGVNTIPNDADTFNVYTILMNVETAAFFLATALLGWLTRSALKHRNINFAKHVQKMDRIVCVDLVVHSLVFVWILFPSYLVPNLSAETRTVVIVFLADLVTLSSPFIILACDVTVRSVVFCHGHTNVVHVQPSYQQHSSKSKY